MEKIRYVVFLRSNPIAPDPRVEKEARALMKFGFSVAVVGWDREGLFPKYEKRDFGDIFRIRLYAKFGRGLNNIFHLFRWQLALIIWLFKNRKFYSFIHACDFDTIIPSLICKFFLRKIVIYDIFDFYADMLRNIPEFLRKVIKKFDLFIINKVDAVIIADDSRIEQIKGSCPKNLAVIYNSPPRIEKTESYFLEEDKTLIICYIGLLQKERGIMEMINVVKRHPYWKLILAGFGGDENLIKGICKDIENVEYLGRVSYEDAIKLYSISDVMFATYDPTIPNHRFSSANKLFEAMMLGKPIIVARNTRMDLMVMQYGLGYVVDYGDEIQLEAVLEDIESWDKEKKEVFSERVKRIYIEKFAWEIMEEKLVKMYKKFLES